MGITLKHTGENFFPDGDKVGNWGKRLGKTFLFPQKNNSFLPLLYIRAFSPLSPGVFLAGKSSGENADRNVD
jgi:hypothetical protein